MSSYVQAVDEWGRSERNREARARNLWGDKYGLRRSKRPWSAVIDPAAGSDGQLDWMDHVSVWQRGRRPVALTAHVHRHFLSFERALELAALEADHGLRIFVRPPRESWQAPGSKMLVEVWKVGAAPPVHAELPEWRAPAPLRLIAVPRRLLRSA